MYTGAAAMMDDPAQLLADALRCDTLRPEDVTFLKAIYAASDVVTTLALVREYYGDGDRSDRTPRPILYLHLGLLGGLAAACLNQLQRRNAP